MEYSIKNAGISNAQKIRISKKLKCRSQFKICIMPTDQSGYPLVVRHEYRWWQTMGVWKYYNVIWWYKNWNFSLAVCLPALHAAPPGHREDSPVVQWWHRAARCHWWSWGRRHTGQCIVLCPRVLSWSTTPLDYMWQHTQHLQNDRWSWTVSNDVIHCRQ